MSAALDFPDTIDGSYDAIGGTKLDLLGEDDAVFNLQLAETARVHEDRLLALMLDDYALDRDRSGD